MRRHNTTKELLAAGAKIDIKDKAGQTPLFAAALGGQVAIVELLLQTGADANVRDAEGWTPLKFANTDGVNYAGHPEVVALLQKYGGKE